MCMCVNTEMSYDDHLQTTILEYKISLKIQAAGSSHEAAAAMNRRFFMC